MRLDTSQWRGFKIDSLFNNFERGKANQTKLEEGSDLFYVGAKRDGNGVMLRCAYNEALVSTGNCVVFISNGQGSVGYANYMDVDFVASTDLVLGYADWLTPEIGLFLATIFSLERPKYSFGRKWGRFLRETVVDLPIQCDETGEPIIDPTKKYNPQGYVPDWQFMENFIRSLNHKPITTQIKSGQAPDLNIASWEEFVVRDVFEIYNGKGITTEEVAENPGTLNAVQSGELTNGVIGRIDVDYCRSMDYTFTEQQCLSVARTGTAGFVAYQAEGCVVGDSAKLLILRKENASRETYMFLRTVLEHNRFKYSYGRKVTEKKYLSDVLDLPIAVHADGKPIIDSKRTFHADGYIPDWQFMEDYMCSLPYGDRIPDIDSDINGDGGD